jgi:hypothetical protein
MPKAQKKSSLDKHVAAHLDLLVNLYFQDVYQKKTNLTLGEWIVAAKPIYPQYFWDWMEEPINL